LAENMAARAQIAAALVFTWLTFLSEFWPFEMEQSVDLRSNSGAMMWRARSVTPTALKLDGCHSMHRRHRSLLPTGLMARIVVAARQQQ
jgi:hypothetical protein